MASLEKLNPFIGDKPLPQRAHTHTFHTVFSAILSTTLMSDDDNYDLDDGGFTDSQILTTNYQWPHDQADTTLVGTPPEDDVEDLDLTPRAPHILVKATQDPDDEDIEMSMEPKKRSNRGGEGSNEEINEEIKGFATKTFRERQWIGCLELIANRHEPDASECHTPSVVQFHTMQVTNAIIMPMPNRNCRPLEHCQRRPSRGP